MSKNGILIVSASTGTGHRSAAEALRTGLESARPSEAVEHVDLLDLAPRWVRRAYGEGYELIATRAPWLWNQVYRYTDGDDHDRARWSELARHLLFREFRRLLLSRNWRHCVCTHFLPCQIAAGRPDHPRFSLVITDFTLHRIWAQPGVDRYFVATDALASEVRKRLPGSNVIATGIPLRPEFSDPPSRQEARAALGLDPRKRVAVIIGGGLGIGVEEMTRATLRGAPDEVQVIAICGRNAAAKSALEGLGLPAARLRVEGYRPDVFRFMASADCVITKPGGLTSSEALSLGRPIIFTRAIPGQESGNARSIAAAGAALWADDPASLAVATHQLLSDDRLLLGLAAGAIRLGRPQAARVIAAELDPINEEPGILLHRDAGLVRQIAS